MNCMKNLFKKKEKVDPFAHLPKLTSEEKPYVFTRMLITIYTKVVEEEGDNQQIRLDVNKTFVHHITDIHQYISDDMKVEVVLEKADFAKHIDQSPTLSSCNGVTILLTDDASVTHANDVVSLGYCSFRMLCDDVKITHTNPFKFECNFDDIKVQIGVPQR